MCDICMLREINVQVTNFINLLNKREFVYYYSPPQKIIHLAHPTKHYTRANNHQSIHLHIIFLILFFSPSLM
jgi:hypothetical protein